MKKALYLFTILITFTFTIYAQTPQVKIPVTVSDGVTSQILNFGLDPSATDGIDTALGEIELPPLPPAGVFDARFLLPANYQTGSLSDYRLGYDTTKGDRTYRLTYQIGTGSAIIISWDLPTGVTGSLSDILAPGGLIVKSIPMSGTGDYTVPNTAITSLDITITYSGIITDIESLENLLPKEYTLYQNYPNPFNPSTTISFSIPAESNVQIKIFNVLGQVVKELINTSKAAGNYKLIFNANNLTSGIYFYRIIAKSVVGKKDFITTKKLIFMK